MSVSPFIRSTLAGAALLAVTAGGAEALAGSADEAAIRGVMAQYNDALNASSVENSLELYADDGVFMPPYGQSAVGKAAVRNAYERVFRVVTLHVNFTIAEIVQMSPEWVFVRTNSAGTNKINATGAMSAEGNQELFIFRKGTDSLWKIARYSFSSTNPLSAP